MTNIRNQVKFLVGLTLALVGMMSLSVPLGHTSSQPAPPDHLVGNPTLTASATNSALAPCPSDIFVMTKKQFDPGVPSADVAIPASARELGCAVPAFFPAGTTTVICGGCDLPGSFKVTVFNVWVQRDATRGFSTQILKFSCPFTEPFTSSQPYRYTDCGAGPFKVGAKSVDGMGTVMRTGNKCQLWDFRQNNTIVRGLSATASQFDNKGTFSIKLAPSPSFMTINDLNLNDSRGICPNSLPSFP